MSVPADHSSPTGVRLRGGGRDIDLQPRLTYEGIDTSGVHSWSIVLDDGEMDAFTSGDLTLACATLPGLTGIRLIRADEGRDE